VIIQRYGFQPVCFTFALLPLVAYLLVHFLVHDDTVEPALVKSA
jgi:hypothetical protein